MRNLASYNIINTSARYHIKLLSVLFYIFSGVGNSAATDVSGIINTETHWTSSGSPYYITGNIKVEKGATLFIEEGVEVIAKNKYKIEVYGRLQIRGTEINRAYLHGEAITSSYNVLWDGIEAKDSLAFIDASYSLIEHASCAINLSAIRTDAWSTGKQKIVFKGCLFYNNLEAIQSGGASSTRPIELINCIFIRNQLAVNGLGDSGLGKSAIKLADFNAVNCHFENNEIAALNIGSVFKCTFKNNEKAIYYGTINVDSSEFTGNRYGIQACLVNCYNSIFNSNDTGISLQTLTLYPLNNPTYSFDFSSIFSNRFENNRYGLIADSSSMPIDTFSCNIFVKNVTGVSLSPTVWYFDSYETIITGHFVENTTAIEVRNDLSYMFDKFNKPIIWKFYGIYFWKNMVNFKNGTYAYNYNLWRCFFCDGTTVTQINNKLIDGSKVGGPGGLVNYSIPGSIVFDTLTGYAMASFSANHFVHDNYDPVDTVYTSYSTESCSKLFDPAGIRVKRKQQINAVVYPNPASDRISVKIDQQVREIQIINLQGIAVKSLSLTLPQNELFIPVDELTSGIYWIRGKTINGASVTLGKFSKL